MIQWNTVEITPPNETVIVLDSNGKEWEADPTFYPFEVLPAGNGKWGSRIEYCEPYWDGGWMIKITMDDMHPGEITHWRTNHALTGTELEIKM